MVTGPWGSIATFLYSRIWNFPTVLTKNKFPGGKYLNLSTVYQSIHLREWVKLPMPFFQKIMSNVVHSDYELVYSSYACTQLKQQTSITDKCGCVSAHLLSTPDMRKLHPFCRKLEDNITLIRERQVGPNSFRTRSEEPYLHVFGPCF